MSRTIGIWVAAVSLLGSASALAQETSSGPATLEVTVIPAGGTFFTSGSGPNFGNYTYGGSVTYNVNRSVGFEAEVGGTAGIAQDLTLGGTTTNLKTPNSLTYTGNVVVSVPTGKSIVPYVTGGVGGLTVFKRVPVGVTGDETFLSGNVGAGVKWYAPNGRWGLRGDYRFIAVRSKDDATAFFGQENQYGHRVYAGLIINAM